MQLRRLIKNRKLLAGSAFVALLLLVALWPQPVAVDVARVEPLAQALDRLALAGGFDA